MTAMSGEGKKGPLAHAHLAGMTGVRFDRRNDDNDVLTS